MKTVSKKKRLVGVGHLRTYVDFIRLWMGAKNCRCDHAKTIQTPLECEEKVWIDVC